MVRKPQLSGKPLFTLLQGMQVEGSIPTIEILDVTSNSQVVVKGSLFIALKGIQSHGIDFAIDAAKAGAAVIVYDALDQYCQQRIPLLCKQVKTHWVGVAQLGRVNGEIVGRFYDYPRRDMSLIGVTGTDGKSSVAHLMVQALGRLGEQAGSIGTLGYGKANQLEPVAHTTPDAVTLQSCLHELHQKQCRYVIMEVSSHALEQYRVNGCKFDIAVLTNLGRDHLDYHGNMERYAAVKKKLFTEFDLKNRIVNIDDEFGQNLCLSLGDETMIRYSAHNDIEADVRLIGSQITTQGQDISVSTGLGEIFASTSLVGDFNVENILACIASLISLGFDLEQVNLAVADLQPIPGRMERFSGAEKQPTAVVDFAHTEQALRACLAASRAHTRGQLWCVFGCGGDRDKSKRQGMGRAAEQLADRIIVTDDNPRTELPEAIVAEILRGMNNPGRVSVVHNRQAAIEFALSQA
ncbi:MAG: UDP-N-acetylmuramoyl-L-alanyl-D-glutamate--2,6-diaminopimelate ligase, partial [Gammaproteobacteria bacterium]|nr:UDP-N-acetylmuramoyl-L-alanyl-D-glutamate--2,6-diaminopimelate ligase [Gammaproteobacteria bacterium]